MHFLRASILPERSSECRHHAKEGMEADLGATLHVECPADYLVGLGRWQESHQVELPHDGKRKVDEVSTRSVSVGKNKIWSGQEGCWW